MRRICCGLSFATALLFSLPLPFLTAGDEFKLEPGYVLLFNGKNLDGWKEVGGKKESLDGKTEAYNGRFKVIEGKLVYDPKVKGDKYIETAKEFDKDVHFKFDFKPGPGCNNDILFRGTKFDIVPGNKENASVEMGKWSTFELVAKGDVIEHKINGKTMRTTKGKAAKASPFKLRAEFGEIEIKNIRCKEG